MLCCPLHKCCCMALAVLVIYPHEMPYKASDLQPSYTGFYMPQWIMWRVKKHTLYMCWTGIRTHIWIKFVGKTHFFVTVPWTECVKFKNFTCDLNERFSCRRRWRPCILTHWIPYRHRYMYMVYVYGASRRVQNRPWKSQRKIGSTRSWKM